MEITSRRLVLLLVALVALVTWSACSDGSSGGDAGSKDAAVAPASDGDAEPQEAPDAATLRDEMSQSGVEDQAQDQGAAQSQAGLSGAAKQPIGVEPKVISTGTVSLRAKDVGQARLDVRKVVDAHQGTVGEQETTTDDDGKLASARLVLRVPSERFQDAISALEEVATPSGTTTSAQDVTGEFVDVEARIRAQRKSVARIEALLARAETIQQIVAIEAQLASRQADLDALQGRQRWLADQTSLSTIMVYIERPSAKDDGDHDGPDGFLGGLAKGWDAFVDGFASVLVAVGFLVPWLVLLALVAGPAWLVVRRRRSAAGGSAMMKG